MLQRGLLKMNSARLFKLLNFWPPFLGAGIQVVKVSADGHVVDVVLKNRFWNRNYFGSHFGGSLYSMCDAFFALILADKLGREFVVWDKSATIRYRKPAYEDVYARFEITPKQVEEIRARALLNPKVEPDFTVLVLNKKQEIIAEIGKKLHVKRKDSKPALS